ncbi:MAG: dihydrolipoyl dehydrogenase [Bacteroidetes bacterium]|nr:dihydrolipoyl dehydrogenase [Bacteroidota bacterium]MCL5033540.1 dihydrolipoyl dehydrogenase [Bacteroidota bacterium]
MAESKKFDLVILGGGPGGYVAAIRAAQLGMKVGCVERDKLGGICLNWGCIPSKALLKSAEVMWNFKESKEYGISYDNLTVDFKKVIKRSRDAANRLSQGVEYLFKKNKIEKVAGTGKFVNKNTLSVTDNYGKEVALVEGKNIIVSTGARPRELPGIKIDRKKVITSTEAMLLESVPKQMIIIGAGAIGAEFAYFYNAFGTKITLIEMMPNVLPIEDAEVTAQLEREFKKQGVEILTDTKVESAAAAGDGVSVKISNKKGSQELKADVALVAVGIQGNTDNIGLENIGVKVEKSWVSVDKANYKTAVDGVYAIGDVIGAPWLAHVASAEGIRCVEGIAGVETEPLDYNSIPGCTYCQPQVASIGLTEAKAKEQGYETKIGRFPFTANGKAIATNEAVGFVKLVFDKKYGELLGAHIIGHGATELIAELGIAKKLETTPYEIIRTVHAHPTLSEAVMEAAEDALGHAIDI